MTPRKRNIVTGVIVLTALAMLMWMVLTFSGGAMRMFRPRGTHVVFKCDRADGLSEGSPVFFKGVEIGKVTAVIRMPDNEHVIIDGELENRPPLPQNLAGEIKAQSSLGSSTEIDLTTRGVAKGAMTAGQEIDIRYVGQSLIPPEITDAVSQANKQELVKHVDEMIVAMRAQVEKVGETIAQANKQGLVQHADETLIALRTQVEKFGKVMESMQAMIGDPKLRQDLAAAMTNIRKATEHADAIAIKLDGLATNTDNTVTAVKKNVDQLTVKVGDNLDKLGQSLQQIQEISAKINNGKGTAGALINDPRLYEELAMTAKQLNAVAATLARLADQWEHEGVSIKSVKLK